VEPERDIEKDLKAYAKRRRTEAGAPGLHPATRKLLHGEVARTLKTAPGGKRPGMSPWSVWLELVATAVAIVAIVAWIYYPKSASHSETATAQKEMMLADNAGAKRKALDQPPTESRRALSPPDESQNEPVPGAAPALAPPPAPVTAAAAPAISAPARPSSERFSALGVPLTPKTNFDRAFGHVAAARPRVDNSNAWDWAESKDAAIYSDGAAAKAVYQKFYRMPLGQEKSKSDSAKGVPNLLDSFRVEEISGTLRVIDKDGSVYTGFVEQRPETPGPAAATLQKPALKSAGSFAEGNKNPLPARMFRFRVTGTNRTLNQEVVFTGDFVNGAINDASKTTATNSLGFDALAPGAAAGGTEPLGLELKKASVSGQLLMGGSNQIQIIALPVKP
jgi:hypothetical protein